MVKDDRGTNPRKLDGLRLKNQRMGGVSCGSAQKFINLGVEVSNQESSLLHYPNPQHH